MPQTPQWTLRLPGRRSTALTWHVDRFLLATNDLDGTLGIWDVTTGDRVTTLNPEVHVLFDHNLLWSPNGSHLTAITDDGRIYVWHTSTGNTCITRKLPALQVIDRLAWSPDKQRIASFGRWERGVQLWDANDGHLITILESQSNLIYELVWSPDGSSLASHGSDSDLKDRVRVWNTATKQVIATYPTVRGEHGRIVLSPDGKRFQTQNEEGAVLIGETTTNRIIAIYHGEETIYRQIVWSPDGKRLALSDKNATIQVVDTASGNLIQTFRGPSEYVEVSWSPDGSRLVAFTPIMMQLWDTATGACIASTNESQYTMLMRKWSSDGLRLAFPIKGGSVQVVDTVSGNPITTYHLAGERLIQITWSSSGSYLACTTEAGIVQVYGGSKAQEMQLLTSYRGLSGIVTDLAWSPDGKRLVTATFSNGPNDQVVHIWEADTGHLLFTYNGHLGPIEALAWSPDGLRLASISPDQVVHIWEADTGHLLFTYNGPSLLPPELEIFHIYSKHLLWSPDGRRLAYASNNQVYLWDAETGHTLLSYLEHTRPIEAIAWSPDGSYLASASDTVQVWEAGTGQLVTTYRGHAMSVAALAWSPDGTRLASASNDRTVQVWEAISGHLLLTYRGHAQRDIIADWGYPTVWSLAWSPDGSHLISGFDREELIQIWETISGKCVATYPGAILKGGTAWSSDGPRFMLRDHETVVRVWQVS